MRGVALAIEVMVGQNLGGVHVADWRADVPFAASVAGIRAAIVKLATANVPDAVSITDREDGWNNLQAHAHSIMPLAVLFAHKNPALLAQIKAATTLNAQAQAEARKQVWAAVKQAMPLLLQKYGNDIIAEEMRSGNAQTVRQVAQTYLSTAYGGGQPNGGAANTVLKRTLKLVAHTFPH